MANFIARSWLPSVWAMALVAALGCAPLSDTRAEEAWNPFAEKDRQAAERAARRRRDEGDAAAANTRTPYLAPMTRFDGTSFRRPEGSRAPPQPYPATPPGYAESQPYDPNRPNGTPGQYAGPAEAQPGVPYGAPGTYMQAPTAPAGNFGAAAPTIERGELTPTVGPGTGGMPEGSWRGVDSNAAEQLLAPLKLPPQSPALSELFQRIIADPVADQRLEAVRVAALIKSGSFESQATNNASSNQPASTTAGDPVNDVLQAKMELATGREGDGCNRVKQAVANQAKLPKQVRGEAIIMAGYCAVLAGNTQAAGLAAELARDSGFNQPFTLAVLEAISRGDRVSASLPARVTLLDGLLLRKLKDPDPALLEGLLPRADAGFLKFAATDPALPPSARLIAAEQAARANILSPAALAEAYRSANETSATGSNAAGQRAQQFSLAERQQAQFAKTRAVRSLLDSAARDGLYHPVAVAVAPIVRTMRPAPEISWFNETAIESLAAAGDYAAARQWATAEPMTGNTAAALGHWLMLLDIADAEVRREERGRDLATLENLALQGRFSQPALHRLVTVLDALDYNVPIPLWNLASRTQQPQTGHLPETGVLSAIKQASENGQIAATVLYALHTIAPEGTSATHLLGLGDTIRALKRAGLEKDARRLAFEALFGSWPRARQ